MPAVLRYLLPIVAALALLVQPVTTWASSGVVGDTSCCCPDPRTCDCHDHPGDDHHDQKIKRCGTQPIDLVTPVLLVAIAPVAAPPAVEPAPTDAPPFASAPLAERCADRPEKPPS